MNAAVDNLRRGRRRWVAVAAAMVAGVPLTAAVSIVISHELHSPVQLAADAAPPPPSVVTAAVERRVLAEPVVLRGKVQPGSSVKVYPPAGTVGANSVVTKVVAKPDAPVREGQVLVERSGEPLFGLVLPFPLYRDIAAGMKGPDVTEVQKALNRLGHRCVVSGEFDSATQRAVSALYTGLGYAARTGAGPSGPAPAGSQATSSTSAVPPSTGSRAVELPQSHVLVLDRPGHTVSAVNVKVGDVLTDPKTALFDLDREPPTVLAIAARDQAGLLRVGQVATATDDAAGTETRAEITAVGAQPVSTDGQTGFEVRLRFAGTPLAADGQRSVRLSVQVAAGTEPVVAVPVTAVFSHADGSTFVTVVDHGTTRDVTITTGLLAGGWVEVRSAADNVLAEGALVVVSERPAIHR